MSPQKKVESKDDRDLDIQLLKPREVDVLFRYPAGRTLRLAKAGKIAFIRLPDGEVRFDEAVIRKILQGEKVNAIEES